MCPVYEYKCYVCDDIVEEFKSVKDIDKLPLCKKCESPMNRIMSLSSFIVNGFNEKNGYSKPKGE